EAVEDKGVCAEIGDFGGHVEIQAVEDGHDGDERRNGKNYTEKSEEGAQLVRTKRVERQTQRLFQGDTGLPGTAQELGSGSHRTPIKRTTDQKSVNFQRGNYKSERNLQGRVAAWYGVGGAKWVAGI